MRPVFRSPLRTHGSEHTRAPRDTPVIPVEECQLLLAISSIKRVINIKGHQLRRENGLCAKPCHGPAHGPRAHVARPVDQICRVGNNHLVHPF